MIPQTDLIAPYSIRVVGVPTPANYTFIYHCCVKTTPKI